MVGKEEKGHGKSQQEGQEGLQKGREVSGHVLAHNHLGVPEHLRTGYRALQATQMAGRIPRDHQSILCRPFHF